MAPVELELLLISMLIAFRLSYLNLLWKHLILTLILYQVLHATLCLVLYYQLLKILVNVS